MKKVLWLVLVLALAFSVAAFAQEGSQEEVIEVDGLRYSVSEDETALTVWLDTNPSTGYDWTFTISDEELLELVTMETVMDENAEEIAGAGGTWAASFYHPVSGLGGNVTLTLTYSRSFAPDPETDIVREIDLWTVENGTLEVLAVR